MTRNLAATICATARATVCSHARFTARATVCSHARFTARAVALAALFAAGPLIQAAHAETLTLYSAQHEQVVDALTAGFTKQTGIKVVVHEGEGPDVASQILQEGANSPADVFFTENSPELILLDEKHLLAPVAPATLAQVPAKYSAADGNWLGVLARENVLAYNPKLLPASALPTTLATTLAGLAQPAWAGKIGFAPSDSDFLPLVSAMIKQDGTAKTLAWLKGMKANAKIYQDDEGVVAAVARGDVAAGIVNNYYWARLYTDLGPAKIDSKLYHFRNGDLGGLVNISGAAVLASSHHQKAAQAFLAYLVSPSAQTALGLSMIDFEYPLRPGVAPNKLLAPFASLQPPAISAASLGDDQQAGLLLQEAGLI
jgi:iron(III) transport system substrate-binding protein